MAHLVGYVGEVSDEMLNRPQWEFYQPGDIVGKDGVELTYNNILMGQNGSRRALVNSRGKEVGRLGETPAVPGKPLKLTVDLDLQIAAETAMADKTGAIIAMNPKNGEILALVSRPAFDPNAFAVSIKRDEWNRLVNDEGHPLMDKAIQAQLAPGSTFKIIMSLAGLQEGIAQTMRVNCPGGGTFFGRYYKCWVSAENRGHGVVDISKAIYQSCDVFFYTLAQRLGIGKIAQYATMLGIGQRTGVDLPHEMSGLMPSEEWKVRTQKQRWYAGEVISVGVGQGAVTVTPIQLMRAISGIMMDGVLQKPHVAFPEELSRYGVQQASMLASETKFDIGKENWDTITDAMALVPTPMGTANSAHLEGIDFAGKTGSAQTMSNELARRLGHSKSINDNAWFVGVTPRRDPDLVVCVLFEGGEHGQYAARMAAQVIKAFVDKKRDKSKDQTLYRAAAAPGLENVPAASPAVLAAVHSDPGLIPDFERAEIAAKLKSADGGPVHSRRRQAATGIRRLPTEFEMAGFWGEPGGEGDELLKAGWFKVKLKAPIAAAVH